MSSPRMSSRNHSPNSVLSKDAFLFCSLDFVLGRIDMGLLLPPLLPLLLFWGGRVLPASWRQRFPDARLKIHLRFNVVRILWASLVILHGRLWRFATQIIEVLFLFAQWWNVIHNSRFVRIRIRRSEFFNDGTCAGGWFWIHSHNFSLMTTVNASLMMVPI